MALQRCFFIDTYTYMVLGGPVTAAKTQTIIFETAVFKGLVVLAILV